MTELQSKLLEMFSWFTSYLDENNYTYYVVYGTLLGTIRHKGFIPWDDDLDIAMPRKDYERLIKSFDQVIDHYKFESPYSETDYMYPYAKLFDINTTLVDHLRKPVKRGIFIDVFPLDGLGNNKEEAIKFHHKIQRKYNFYSTQTCALRKGRKWYKNLAIIIGRINLFFNAKKYAQKLDKLAALHDYDSSEYVACVFGAYAQREVFDKKIFAKPVSYKFENINVKGPEQYDAYLKQLYHDWTKLPEESKRGVQHDFVEFDLNKPYLQ